MRITMNLNGRWRFCPAFDQISTDQRWLDPDFDPDNPDLTPQTGDIGWIQPEFDDSGWLDIMVPGSWNSEFEELWSYEGRGWYRRKVQIPVEWEGRRIEFHSEGANYRTIVHVNGVTAGEHDGGYSPFAIPIHHLLQYGAENTISVTCDNIPKPERVPGGQFDWWNHGGLYRDVSLRITDSMYIDDVTATTNLLTDEKAEVVVDVVVRCEDGEIANRAIDVQLFDPAGEPVELPRASQSQMLTTSNGHAEAKLTLPVEHALLWTPDDPHLYRLVLTINDSMSRHNGDTWSMRIGLREIRVDGTRLLLNGRPIVVKGVNRYEDYSGDNPGHGRPKHTHDEAMLGRDLDLVKWMGANALRSHYPPHRRHFELCDERGIMNLVELPLYQWGRPLVETACAEALEPAKEQLTEIIRSLKNHPSVIIWSVSNENLVVPRSDDPETIALAKQTADGNIELVHLAHELDPTRPAVEISNCWPDDPVHEHTDITAVNVYVGTNVNDPRGFPDTVQRSRDKLADQRQAIPDKPILAGEWGSWAMRGMHTDYFPGEEYQAGLISAVWNGLMEEENLIGGFVWAFADSDVHRHFLWVYEFRCAYGLFDIHRNAKAGAHAMREIWTKTPTFRD
jgi:beta-galactosidase/beta-glucuronidase